VDRILHDVSRLSLSGDRLLAEALPAPGLWIAEPGSHRFSELIDELLANGFSDEAMALAVRLDAAAGNGQHQASLKTKAARRLAQQGDIAGATRELQEAIRLERDSAVARMELGTIYGRQNELPSAVFHLSEAVRLDDQGLPDAHLNLGVALRRMGRKEEAVRSLQRALAIDPLLAPAHVNLALIRAGQGRMEEATTHFREAIRLDPSDVPSRINLAAALWKRKQREAALGELQRVLESQPNLPLALTYACEILSELGRRAEAIDMLRGAVIQQPQVAPLRFLLGRHLQEEGHAREALEQYTECERLDRGNAQAVIRIAWIQSTSPDEQLRNGDSAVRLATRAVARTGRENVQALDTLAAAHAQAGQYEAAVATAQEALQMAQTQGTDEFATAIRQRLDLYRRAKPYRDHSGHQDN
jgi:tetratricopeptide (TPR) repeat protein